MGIGDWGLGIGPIPNPQSPSPLKIIIFNIKKINIKNLIYQEVAVNSNQEKKKFHLRKNISKKI